MKKLLFSSIACVSLFANNIGVSILPQVEIVKKLMPSANVITLMPAGADPHTYEPKPKQMLELSKAQLFLGIGVEIEEVWLKRLAENTKIKIIQIDENITKNKYSHQELNEHHHEHNDDVYNGIFDDNDVRNRDLSDWAGDWKSIYPYALNGDFDEYYELKAKDKKDKTKEEYKQYYLDGYKTNVEKIIITKDSMEFIQNNKSIKSNYKYVGYKILTYESGKKGVRYLFEATNDKSPFKYVQFSDHNIQPTKDLGHFHIFFGNSSQEELLNEMVNWPTYYHSNMTSNEIKKDLIHHLGHKNDEHHEHHHEHSSVDVHIWTDPIILKQLAINSANALKQTFPQEAKNIDKNLKKYEKELDELNLKIYDLTKDVNIKGFISSHPAWGYFAKRYGLSEYTLELEGKDIKPSELAKIIEIAKDKKACVILKAPQFDDKLAKSIHKESGLKLIEVNQLSNEISKELLKFAKIINDNCSKH